MTVLIGISGPGSAGKTSLIKLVDDTLIKFHGFVLDADLWPRSKKEIRHILKGRNIRGKTLTVALCSPGDDSKWVKGNLKDVFPYKPDFIVLACRVWDDGYRCIENKMEEKGNTGIFIRLTQVKPKIAGSSMNPTVLRLREDRANMIVQQILA